MSCKRPPHCTQRTSTGDHHHHHSTGEINSKLRPLLRRSLIVQHPQHLHPAPFHSHHHHSASNDRVRGGK